MNPYTDDRREVRRRARERAQAEVEAFVAELEERERIENEAITRELRKARTAVMERTG